MPEEKTGKKVTDVFPFVSREGRRINQRVASAGPDVRIDGEWDQSSQSQAGDLRDPQPVQVQKQQCGW